MREKVSESELIQAITNVFRSYGYEGASMARISQATGLQKSSLYHRFPGGKQEMAAAVTSSIIKGVESDVLTPLWGQGSLKTRIKKAGERISAFYEGGHKPCILDTLSLDSEQADETYTQLRTSYGILVDGFTKIAIEAGHKPKTARERATRAVVLIEGALIITRVTGENSQFERVIDELAALLGT